MKKAEILTSNNVAIQYEMASLFQRIVAFLLDGLILGVYFAIVNFIFFIIAITSNY